MAEGGVSLRCLSVLLALYSFGVVCFLLSLFTRSTFSPLDIYYRRQVARTGSLAIDGRVLSEKGSSTDSSAFSNSSKNLTPRNWELCDFKPLPGNRGVVYSAYYNDINRPPEVTVVAIVNRSAMTVLDMGELTCVYSGSDVDGGVDGGFPGRLTILPDHHGQIYGPAFIRCSTPLFTPMNTTSLTVSFRFSSQDGAQASYSSLKVHPPRPRQYKFLICFSPLHRNFGDVVQVVENLELAQALGAEHAVVYNSSITPAVDRVLRHYVQRGLVEVKSWRDPPEPIHYKGQMAAINDCLMDNLHRTDFIVYMDFDEMIVPRVHQSWSAMIEAIVGHSSSSDFVPDGKIGLNMSDAFVSRISETASRWDTSNVSSSSTASSLIGAFAFPSTVYLWDKPTNLTKKEVQFAQRLHVPFLLKQKRLKQLWTDRSKNIVNPRTVDIMGIHRVSSFHSDYRTLLVNESVGLLQHYRWYSNLASIKDTSILRFAPLLVRKMNDTFNQLKALYPI